MEKQQEMTKEEGKKGERDESNNEEQEHKVEIIEE